MPTRREVLVQGAAALALAPFGACSRGPEPPPLPAGAIRVPLASLPEDQRVASMRFDEPIELIRTKAGVVARSLHCTHMGCRLAWNAEAERYDCPCHGGAFDAAGRPLEGPPTERMRTLPVRVEGDHVVIHRHPSTRS